MADLDLYLDRKETEWIPLVCAGKSLKKLSKPYLNPYPYLSNFLQIQGGRLDCVYQVLSSSLSMEWTASLHPISKKTKIPTLYKRSVKFITHPADKCTY